MNTATARTRSSTGTAASRPAERPWADVRGLAALWGQPSENSVLDRDDWLRAWQNIDVLAQRVFATIDAEQRCDAEVFQNILLAVGNFKRQVTIHLPVTLLRSVGKRRVMRFMPPDGLGRRDCDDVTS
jgi:hypothetical protein